MNENIRHYSDNKNECIYQKDHYNGIIRSKLLIFDKSKRKSTGVSIEEWKIYLLVLFILYLISVLIAAIMILMFAKKPAQYLEDCKGRSCVGGLDLKCLDNICKCNLDEYYLKKCEKKKLFNETCTISRQCYEQKGLQCYNGKCVCKKTEAWNQQKCYPRKYFGDNCNNDCLENLMLTCNSGLCSCNSTRFWDGFVCKNKRTYGEWCKRTEECNNYLCLNGICKITFTIYIKLRFTIFFIKQVQSFFKDRGNLTTKV